jgi:hypothetical protein
MKNEIYPQRETLEIERAKREAKLDTKSVEAMQRCDEA